MRKFCTSEITYDGADLPTLGIKTNDSLNVAYAKIEEAYRILKQANQEVSSESFNGIANVSLNNFPYRILAVISDGFVIPDDSYRISGKSVIMNTEIYNFSEDASIKVLYMAMIK